MDAIVVDGLEKSYKDVRALDGMSFSVPAGQVFGLLGPNGAGKSTTVRALTTLTRPDGGAAHVAGHDVLRERGVADDARKLDRRMLARTGDVGGPATADHHLAGAELLQRDRPVGVLHEVADQRASRLGDVHVQRLGVGRHVHAEIGGEFSRAGAGCEHDAAGRQLKRR